MKNIHPKVAWATVGAALGTCVVALLSASGHPAPDAVAAQLPALGTFIAGFLAPAGSNSPDIPLPPKVG